MKVARYLECFDSDAERLREAAALARSVRVPSCPGWTGADLAKHVADVYLHKASCIRFGHHPDDWHPEESDEDPFDRLGRALRELRTEFAEREAGQTRFGFVPTRPEVGFWIRRMAQETAVHRYDAELATGSVTPVAEDLALDGVDEMLTIFVGWEVREFASDPEVAELLAEADGRSIAIRSGSSGYLVRATSSGVDVTAVSSEVFPADVAATVTGEPSRLLLWLWHRVGDDAVRIDGDVDAIAYLHRVLTVAGQ